MLGLKSPCSALFQNIEWSEESVFDDTLTAANNENLTLETLPPLTDIDHLSEWNAALQGPLGSALKKALGEEPEDLAESGISL